MKAIHKRGQVRSHPFGRVAFGVDGDEGDRNFFRIITDPGECGSNVGKCRRAKVGTIGVAEEENQQFARRGDGVERFGLHRVGLFVDEDSTDI